MASAAVPVGMKLEEMLPSSVDGFPFSDKVVEVRSDSAFEDAVETLAVEGISAAPVRDHETGRYIGWIATSQLVDVLADVLSTYKREAKVMGESEDDMLDMKGVFVRARALGPVTVATACTSAPFRSVVKGASLHSAVRQLHTESAVQRVAVMASKAAGAAVVKIITQSAVAAEVAKVLRRENSIMWYMPLNDLGLHRTEGGVVCVGLAEHLADAFLKMKERRISAVGVVDDDGRLVTSITCADARWLMTAEHSPKMHMTVSEFVADRSKHRGHTCVMVSPETTLGRALDRMVKTRVHRVFVTDDEDKPLGVVSFRDVLHVLDSPPEVPLTAIERARLSAKAAEAAAGASASAAASAGAAAGAGAGAGTAAADA